MFEFAAEFSFFQKYSWTEKDAFVLKHYLTLYLEKNLKQFLIKITVITLEIISVQFSSVQSLSRVWLFVTRWTAARQPPCPLPTPGVHPNTCPLSRWCHPTISSSVIHFSSCLQSFPASGSFQMSHLFTSIGQSFSFNISPSNEYSGLISFRMDWLDLLAVQGTLKSLLQYHSSKASILWCSAFFIFQLSHPYMTSGKTIALTRWTFVGKVMSLLFKCYLGWS